MTYKVVRSACYGGFSLSEAAQKWISERGFDPFAVSRERHHPVLVRCVEALGASANGRHSKLEVATVDGPYKIDEYDGYENVVEPHHIVWIDPSKLRAVEKKVEPDEPNGSEDDIVAKTRDVIARIIGPYIDEDPHEVRRIVERYVMSGKDDPGGWSRKSPVIIHCDGTGIPSGEYDTKVFDAWFEVSDALGGNYYIDRINHVVLCVTED